MRLLWRVFLRLFRGKCKITVIKTIDREFYFMVIARYAMVDLKELDKHLAYMNKEYGIVIKGIMTNDIEGIKFL